MGIGKETRGRGVEGRQGGGWGGASGERRDSGALGTGARGAGVHEEHCGLECNNVALGRRLRRKYGRQNLCRPYLVEAEGTQAGG